MARSFTSLERLLVVVLGTWLLVLTAAEQASVFTTGFPLNYEFSNSTGGKIICKANQESESKISWLLSDGSLITDVPRLRQVTADGSLLFPSFGAEDYRQDIHGVSYRCAASNTLGTLVSNEIKVKGVVDQSFDVHVYDVYTIRGNTAVMRCHIPKFLQPYVKVTTWIKDSVVSITSATVDTNSKYLLLPSGELIIKDVDSNDAHTTYRCQVTHSLLNITKTSSNSGRLIVTESAGKVPPKIIFSNSQLIAIRNQTIFISCVANGLPIPKYSWSKQTISGALNNIDLSKYATITNGLLIIPNAQIHDSGIYTCDAINEVNSERISTKVSIIAPLKVTVSPEYLLVNDDQSFYLNCKIDGSPISSIVWTKDGKSLPRDGVVQIKNETIHIPKMLPFLAGIYQCFAENEFFSSYGVAVVKQGNTMPTIFNGFEEQVLEPGDNLKIQCSSRGNPVPQFHWTLDNIKIVNNERTEIKMRSIGENEVSGTLIISNLKTEDGGLYRCLSENTAGQSSYGAKINIKGKLGVRANVKYYATGKQLIQVDCPVYGYPIKSIVWNKNDMTLPLHMRQACHKNGSLIIHNVQKMSDSGNYKCIVTGINGQKVEGNVELIVLVPPKITPFSFQDDLIREGARARIQCVVSEGQNPITLMWFKDSQPLSKGLGITIREVDEYSSILMISSISPHHNGNYTCVAQNIAGSTQHSASLFVNVPPKWILQPNNVIIRSGNDLYVNCQAEGFPMPKIEWRKSIDLENINSESRSILEDEKVKVLSNGTLFFKSITRTYEGFYICIASNGIGESISRVVSIKVQAAPFFKNNSYNLFVRKGDDVNISCEAEGNWPITYTWSTNDNQNIGDYGNKRYKIVKFEDADVQKSASVLKISWVDRKDSTNFTCLAKNEIGHNKMHINLKVQELPESPIIEVPVRVVNQTIYLSWLLSFDGNSHIKNFIIQYKKDIDRWNDKDETIVVSGSNSFAEIQNLKPATRYNFRVLAENDIGNGTFSEVINVKTEESVPEGAPENVDVESMDANTLRVTWKPPKKTLWNGVIRGYNIGHKISTSHDKFTFSKLEVPEDYTEELIYQLTELQMYTQYDIVVQAYNSKGSGPKSEPILAMTSEDVPSEAPNDVRCNTLSAKSIYVLWSSLKTETINGILRGYKIFYKPAEEWYNTLLQTQITSINKITLHNLEADSNYTIQISAFTKMGDGIKSDPIFCKTHEDVPQPPETIKVLPSSSDSVVVSWKPPQKLHGSLSKFTIYYKPIKDGQQIDQEAQNTQEFQRDAKFQQSQPNTHFTELKGLQKNQKYAFWVTATSNIGESDGSAVVAQTVADSIVQLQLNQHRLIT